MNALATSVIRQGWVAWNIEYRRVGPFGGGGGWPSTFDDVLLAIDHLGAVDGLDVSQVVTVGHSAGGALALWAAAHHRGGDGGASGSLGLTVHAAISLAGVVDLEEADRLGLGRGATAKLLGGHRDEQESRYRQASPAALLPFGLPQVLLHGLDDRVVPASMSASYERRALEAGDSARYIPVKGAGHRDVIDPDGPAWRAALKVLGELFA